ncbi:MAG TPA: hypothetical protein PLK99_09255 [Burkholderiales bacterium]|nr:hypothetical protein [Burkholderiales bacterium]
MKNGFILLALFSQLAGAQTMRVCEPINAPSQKEASGLSDISNAPNYSALCHKRGFSCKPSAHQTFDQPNTKCFTIYAKGKIPAPGEKRMVGSAPDPFLKYGPKLKPSPTPSAPN